MQPQQAALGQHGAVLLDGVAEILVQIGVIDDNSFAKQRTALGSTQVEHIAQVGVILQVQVIGFTGKAVSHAGTIHKQVQAAVIAGGGKVGQLLLGVQGAVLSGVGDIHHAGLGNVLVTGIGPVSIVSIPHLLGGNFALHAGQGKALVAGGFHRAGFMYIDMPAVGTQHALPGF